MRTEYCGNTDTRFLGQTVTLFGWAHRRRDHGGVIFIDLRDREGLVQVVCDPDRAETFDTADRVRNEFVLRVTGVVRRRPEGTVNPDLKSGEIEVLAHEIEILNPAATPPFMIDDEQISRGGAPQVPLPRPAPPARCSTSCACATPTARAVRDYLDDHGFIDVETPVLYKTTPEGAREFLVPSRMHDGQFYALPQSPQLFKQMLMVAGFDRYYQIVKCFRDEDLRADRQPEFTQIDIETSFLTEREIQDLMEGLVRHVFKSVLDVDLPPFPRLTYAEATSKYGSDKPDLRVKLELTELTDMVRDAGFKVFKSAAELKDGRVAALRVPGGNEQFTRKELDDLTPFVAIYGAKGLAYIRVNDPSKLNEEGLQSPIVKFLVAGDPRQDHRAHGREGGRPALLRRRPPQGRERRAGRVAHEGGPREGPRREGLAPVLGAGLPRVRVRRGQQALGGGAPSVHEPKDEHVEFMETRSGEGAREGLRHRAERLGAGRRLGADPPRRGAGEAVRGLGIGAEEQRAKFGFLLDALAYGAPPHGGIAFGLDRMVAMMAGVDQIRDVIAFPKTQRGRT